MENFMTLDYDAGETLGADSRVTATLVKYEKEKANTTTLVFTNPNLPDIAKRTVEHYTNGNVSKIFIDYRGFGIVLADLIREEFYKSGYDYDYTANTITEKIPKVKTNLAEELLELSIKHGVLMTALNNDTRGIGKTVALIKKAHELDATIVVGTVSTKHWVKLTAKELGLEVDCVYFNSVESAQGSRLGKFLVDDTTPNIIVVTLIDQGNTCLGGFNTIYASVAIPEAKKTSKSNDNPFASLDGTWTEMFSGIFRVIDDIDELMREKKND